MHAVKENKIVTGTKKTGSFFGKARCNAFFAPAVVQSKLTIGPVDDPYEREADTVADRVMRMTDADVHRKPVVVQRKCAECEKEEQLQRKEDNDFITSMAGKNIQRSPGDNDVTPGNEENNQAVPFLRIRITLHDSYDREDTDIANYGEANIEMIRRGVLSPGDYTVPYAALWANNYRLSTRWGLGRITKNLYEKGDNLLKPIRGIVGKIPLAGGFISSKIKLSKPDLKGGDWDRYIADKTTLTALGGALDRNNPAYNAGSGFTFTVNIVDFHFDENRLFRKPANDNYTSAPFEISRKCAQCDEEDKKAQMKSEAANGGGITAPSIVHDVISRSGQPLDVATRNFMESRIGFDFRNVQIHNDSEAHQSSAAINALAYTSGNHIVFGTGQYQPDTDEGKKLLAHELTHVVQQDNGISRQIQRVPCSGYSFKTLTYASVVNEHDFAALDGYTPLKGRAYDILSDGKKYFFCYNNQKIFIKYIDTKLVPDLKSQLEENYKIKIEKGGKNWSDTDLILLNEAFSRLTAQEAALVEDYRFIREKQSAVVDGDIICGLHSVDIIKRDYTIQIADACIKDPLGKEKTKFGIDYGVFNILHEIGHAIEYGRLRLATEKYYNAKNALEQYREQYDKASPDNQKSMIKQLGSLKNTMDKAFDELDRVLDKSTVDQFSKLIKGKRALTDYSKKNAAEAFAEAFAIFKANPKKLKKDNKKLFDWFLNTGFR